VLALPLSARVALVLGASGFLRASTEDASEHNRSRSPGLAVRRRTTPVSPPDKLFDRVEAALDTLSGMNGLPGFDDRAQDTAGTNLLNDYTYRYETDCYGSTAGGPYQCPPGTWCQVEARVNWYPYDVGYMNRGRCVNYTRLGGACESAFEGETAFPRKADGSFFSRPVLCGPEAVCTGEELSKVVPPTCVERRDPRKGCMSSYPFCAGRPIGPGNTTEERLKTGGCPAPEKDFCVCPKGSEPEEGASDMSTSCMSDSRVTRQKLEQCGSIFVSHNGPNFAFQFRGFVNRSNVGLPSDANIEGNQTRLMKKLPMYHGMNTKIANDVLVKLWPYPVCDADKGVTEGCTKFPLPATERDDDGGLTGNYVDGSPADFIPTDGNGVTDYHCSWMVMHTLSFNGPAVLTSAEQKAFAEMLMYMSGQFDCKVCRNNFVHIIEAYGLPTGPFREAYAKWLWRAHNIANEHTYATHSPSNQQILESNSRLSAKDRRMDMWANPEYMHPWLMPLLDAEMMWTL
jgi:hypothetical protein